MEETTEEKEGEGQRERERLELIYYFTIEQIEQVRQLENQIQTAREKNLRFLNILTKWTDHEKAVFKNGVSKYCGRARIMYCELVGLSFHLLNTADRSLLCVSHTFIHIETNTSNPILTHFNMI